MNTKALDHTIAGKKSLLATLKALSASGAVLKYDAVLGEGSIIQAGGKGRPVTAQMLSALQSRGFVERTAGQPGDLCLSPAGRMALRRWLSAGDGFLDQHRNTAESQVPDPCGARRFVAATVNLAESPLIWLASRKDRKGRALLDRAQVEAGERLRADYEFSRLAPRVSTGWRTEAPGGGKAGPGRASDLSDDVIAARQRVERTLAALEPVLASLLVDVCCHLKGLKTVEMERGWPARSGKVVLQIALTSLADRYGYRTVAAAGDGQILSCRAG